MSEAIPLCPALCIQRIEIIVSQAFNQWLNLMLEFLAVEGGDFGDVQGETVAIGSISFSRSLFLRFLILQRDCLSHFDLRRGGFDSSWGEEVQASEL